RVGRPAQSRALADSLSDVLARERARTPSPARPRVLFVVAREPGQIASFTAAGRETYIDELIALAGGSNALSGSRIRYPQLSAESVLRLDPDVILEWSPLGPAGSAATEPPPAGADAGDWARLGGLSAVRSGRVHALHEDLWLRPGPRVGRALLLLKRLLAARRCGS
ncbi:MAG: ABC transporter substrate-binding protein, partial [Gemmatimonadetes bacterium]|nr:ABC transporter substrate-binding protein [Gemmatimonadota bacterium]